MLIYSPQDSPIEILETTEGVKTIVRCISRFGVPDGDWRPCMEAVVTNSRLHLDPAYAKDIGPGRFRAAAATLCSAAVAK